MAEAPRAQESAPSSPQKSLRPWQAGLAVLALVGGWVMLQWLALPYDGSDVKDAAPPLNLVPLAPVEADPTGVAPEAPTPWAAPEAAAVLPVPVTVHLATGTGRVSVDGGPELGTTPMDVPLAPGPHRVAVAPLDGSAPVVQDIVVEPERPQTLVIGPD